MITKDMTKELEGVDENEACKYEPFEEGVYEFLVEDVDLKYGKDSGSPYLNVKCFAKSVNKRIWKGFFFTGKPYPKLMLRRLLQNWGGIDVNKEPWEFEERELIGTVFRGKVKNQSKRSFKTGDEYIASDIDTIYEPNYTDKYDKTKAKEVVKAQAQKPKDDFMATNDDIPF